ncbi:MAG: phosphatase PAP2 family protein [Candidatus Micrarchaeia archaeon]|jgi:membrane-associated phospholipid phosphatase
MEFATGASSAEMYFVLACFGFVALLFSQNRKAMFIAVILATVSIPVLKNTLNEDRPCIGWASCPDDAGMPSGHSTLAFIFAAGSLGSPAFWFFFPASILVGFSRTYWGAHSLSQVAAGAGLGIALFFISQELLIFLGEVKRQRTHWKVKRFVKMKRLAARRKQVKKHG